MTTRKILAAIVALAIALGGIVCLSGCSTKPKEFELTESETGGLVAISRQMYFIEDYNYTQTILYDPDTFVMYSMITGGSGAMSITVLYNADGTPKLYDSVKN